MSIIKHNLDQEMTELIETCLEIGADLGEIYSVLLGHQENIELISTMQEKRTKKMTNRKESDYEVNFNYYGDHKKYLKKKVTIADVFHSIDLAIEDCSYELDLAKDTGCKEVQRLEFANCMVLLELKSDIVNCLMDREFEEKLKKGLKK